MISPQGYNLGEDPKAKNPFWDGSGEDSDVNRIYATATVDENVGTPSVQTTKSIDGHDITFGFEFHNLKGRDGTDGRDGTNGTNGTDGVSPTITVTDITGGHRVSITDATGTHSFDVMNGQNGQNGRDGRDGRDGTNGQDGRDGTDGVSPSVSVSDITGGHRITVTDATGSETFDVMNGTDGRDGTNGTNGADGVSPTVTVTDITGGHQVSITDAQGTQTFNVMNGTDGTNGNNGQDGADGVSPTVSVTSITGGHQVSITDAQGTDTFNVMDGQDGTNGTNGQDGVTPDISMSATTDATSSANPSVTVTKGGTTANPTFALAFSGLKGAQGNPGQDAEWPSGGSVGDILTKTASGVAWSTPSGGGGMELIGTYNYGTNMKTIFADIYSHANNDDIVMFVRNDQYGNTPLRCSLPRYSQGTSGNENSCLRYTMTASGISLGSYIPSYMILGNKKFLCKKYPDSRYPKLTLTDASMLGKMAEDELNPAYIAYLTLQHKMSYVSAGGICQSWSSNGGGYMFVNINRELETSLDAATLTIDYSCKVYVLRAGS